MVLTSLETLASGFEGCEKKLEIDFKLTGDQTLRDIPRETIDEILSQARCTIIGNTSNEHFDSYVLSESSLFVYPSKFLLKTCGTTLLLKTVSHVLKAAAAVGAEPDFLQFSRSNFIFPHAQQFPHRAFDEESKYLNDELKLEGHAFILGPVNGPRWHLYIIDWGVVEAKEYKQQTLEILMFNLPRDVMEVFYRKKPQQIEEEEKKEKAAQDDTVKEPSPKKAKVETADHIDKQSEVKSENGETKTVTTSVHDAVDDTYSSTGADTLCGSIATRDSGIIDFLPGSNIESHLFDPCGYSCNGLLDDAYFTIHITPEPQCSFVSFETNWNTKSYTSLVQKVIKAFRPGNFCCSLFVDEGAMVENSHRGVEFGGWSEELGYVAKGVTHHMFESGYNATFTTFAKTTTESS